VVIISADGKSHRFIPGSPECEGITAVMLSPNRKLLAVAERAEKAVVSVYDMQTLKRRKQLVAADVGSKVRGLNSCMQNSCMQFRPSSPYAL
jgi:hypothetical protein